MNENKFEFTYKAPTESERRTIESIRSQYEEKSKAEGDYERLVKLDKKVRVLPTILSITLGVIGLLIFGLGLTMVLEWDLIAWGVLVAIVGAIPMGIAPFLHKSLLQKNKKKYGDEILELSEKLLKK
ncbi:MAG: hypothetical protein J6A96_00390 [Clostridia bacterium]|nr:hypothetical protein [Clostridia bacterium]